MSFSVSNLSEWRSTRFSVLIYTGLMSAVIGDVLIAGSLCVILRIHVKEIPRSRTSNTIRLLIAYSIETCGLTSVCTLACLLTYATVRHNYTYISLYLLLSKFSLNALLATLNARRGLRAASEESCQPSTPVFGGATESNSDTLSTYDGTLAIQSHVESEPFATKDNCSTPEVNSYRADKARSLDTIAYV
ncbi:hypothetical protein DAEQUDRAFT_180747 [Daedalea quercina L-15889]|uniref:DUF6534 domain-containing protein n=1 Tax=Daedalea quercina L-15889 TaxID=1314783 RepID=A0A165REH0_9APHY|nr:hypothetical protein DAEQUDRAFT_180747 [Daedalea quercina L-15889]